MNLRRARELAFVIIGVITPVGVLAVNASAFIMQHLGEFRLTIAGCALVSALLLNGVAAYSALRYAERNATPLFTEYRIWIVSVAVLAVLISAGVTTVMTYLGMRDPHHLPDLLSVLGSLAALAMPFALTYVQRRILRVKAPPKPRPTTGPRPAAGPGGNPGPERLRRPRPRPFEVDTGELGPTHEQESRHQPD